MNTKCHLEFFQSCDKNTEQFFCVLNIPDIQSFILPGIQAIITTGHNEAQVFSFQPSLTTDNKIS